MRHFYNDTNYLVEPINITNQTPKDTLQYAIGALIYTPATDFNRMVDAIIRNTYNIKSIAICMEDASGDIDEQECLKNIKLMLIAVKQSVVNNELDPDNSPLIFIRVRHSYQINKLNEVLEEEQWKYITGIIAPKFDTVTMKQYLTNIEELNNNLKHTQRTVYLLPILESASIMDIKSRQKELKAIYNGVIEHKDLILNIRVGATDLCGLYGLRRSACTTIYDIKPVINCISDVYTVFGKDFICSAPVNEQYGNTDDIGYITFTKEVLLDKENGFIGKTCIHPTQIDYVNRSLIVSENDFKDAQSILNMFNNGKGVSRSANGKSMLERNPHINWAKKVLKLSEIYGVSSNKIEL